MERTARFSLTMTASGVIWFVSLFFFQLYAVGSATTKWEDSEALFMWVQPIPYFIVLTLLPAVIILIVYLFRRTKSQILLPVSLGLLFGGFLFLLGYLYIDAHMFDSLV